MRDAAKLLYTQAAGDLFALLMPLSVSWPIGTWTPPEMAALYIAPVLHLSDLALVAFLFTGAFPIYRTGRDWRSEYLFATPLLCLGGLAVLTAPFALNPPLAAYTALRWLAAAAVSLRILQGDINLPRFVTVFLVGLLVHVVVGMGQVLLQRPLGLPGEMALPLTQPGAAIVALGDPFASFAITPDPDYPLRQG